MNADFDPEQPDAARDPLLAALRRQLGESFGQAPPPQTWAGIRQRLAPRPWWRPRHLLPAFTLLLSFCTVVGLLVARRHSAPTTAAHQPARQPHLAATPELPANSPAAARNPARPVTSATHASSPDAPAVSPAPLAAPAAGRPGSVVAANRPVASSRADGAAATTRRPADATLPAPPAATPGRAVLVAAPADSRRHPTPGPAAARAATSGAHQAAGWALTAATAADRRSPTLLAGKATERHRPAVTLADRHQLGQPGRVAAHDAHDAQVTGQPVSQTARPDADAARVLASAPGVATRRERPLRQSATLADRATTQPAGAAQAAGRPVGNEPTLLTRQPEAAALLALHPVPLALPPVTQPATLQPLPDSSRPPRPRFRAWAWQVLAGPTFSYRTVPAHVSASVVSPATGPATNAAVARPAFYNYERPALGWGAQVQARRVLTGRWALALGLGYHEYATRLDLQVRQPTDSLLLAVRQRDTYRMLTVPVQVSYALGPPRGPLALALLAGAEPGWYRGGRVTEGSDCGCQQQTFAQAADSPYNDWNVALSLGFDLRYRLGGPASRWQLLVQPTGRYVATPFVRNGVSGYVRRQPYSLGLLAGLAWDWR